jgi:ferredoxin-NADP reductase
MTALVIVCLAMAAFATALALLIRGVLYRPASALNLVVARRDNAGSDLFSITLRRPFPACLLPLPRFAAGQSVQLAIPGEPVKRRYSIARWQAIPFAYELTIKREQNGRFSPRLADHARPGARLLASRPCGHFTLPRRCTHGRAVFIAGGVGITPLLAMVEQWAKARRPYREVHLYWQIRHDHEALYRDALGMLAQRHPELRVRILVSRPMEEPARRITAELLAVELGALSNTDFYLCAGAALLDSMLVSLGNAGVAAEALHFERFTLGAAAESDEGWTLAYEGECFAFAGRASLLDAIEARCLAIDSDCRTGSCGRCMLAVEEGEAKHRITPEYDVPPRHVLACCAVPKSDIRLRAVGAAR